MWVESFIQKDDRTPNKTSLVASDFRLSSYENVMFAISLPDGLPNQNSCESNRAEQAAENYSWSQFAPDMPLA